MNTTSIVRFSFEAWGAAFCLIAGLIAVLTKDFDKKGSISLILLMFVSAMYLGCDSCTWFFRGDTSDTGRFIVRFFTFLSLLFAFVSLALAATYYAFVMSRSFGNEKKRYLIMSYSLSVAGIAALVLSRIFGFMYDFDAENNFVRTSLGWIPHAVVLAAVLLAAFEFIFTVRYNNVIEKWAISSILAVLGMSLIITLVTGVQYVALAYIIAVVILFLAYERRYTNYMIEQEKKLNDVRLSLINKQMKPHFIFNSLSMIRSLCRNSPEGVEAINDFSFLLRESINLLNQNECVKAGKEFEIVDHFINIITKRFEEEIVVEYNIENDDFSIPPFAVQTLVENSVRHGIRKRENRSGRIVINSYRKDGNNIIEIIDDGVGFDPDAVEGSELHTGISNTRQRVEQMCSGRLEIISAKGKGTTARIIIPAG